MNDDRGIFGRLAPPAAPSGLRERALSAAAAALAREPRGVWTRIWESRTFRMSWSAAVALLVAANVLFPVFRRRPRLPVSAAMPGRGDRDFGAAVGLPRVDPDAPSWSLLDEEDLLERLERPNRLPAKPLSKEKSS